MEEQLERIADAFERIAYSLEIMHQGLNLSVHLYGDIGASLIPSQRAFKVELSNCTDTETPSAVQIDD